jgi:1,4-dihydroxy-2-naphthoate octaprenyltransferase
MKQWILAFRPKTLSAAVAPCVLAASFCWSEYRVFTTWIFFCALFSAICIQIGTNLINDAKDFEKGTDREDRLGPQRLTQTGLVSAKKVFAMGSLKKFLPWEVCFF